jgi:hypothetical protein
LDGPLYCHGLHRKPWSPLQVKTQLDVPRFGALNACHFGPIEHEILPLDLEFTPGCSLLS